jgi:hypothetical protein
MSHAPGPVTHYSGKPGLEPPEGKFPQFDNPPNRNTEALAGIIICIVLTSFCIITRGTYMASTRQRLTLADCEYLHLAGFLFIGIEYSSEYTVLAFSSIVMPAKHLTMATHSWRDRVS